MEITKSYRKMVATLATAKGRRENGLFVAEGTKCVLDTINSFNISAVLATSGWISEYGDRIKNRSVLYEVKRADIIEMSSLSTPPDVIAVYQIPDDQPAGPVEGELYLALDRIQDPGNLGTIIRVSSWMGISRIYCSQETVDVYNPKVVQATMGALSQVKIEYCDLTSRLAEAKRNGIPVYGTFLDGENIYTSRLTPGGIIVMGNEGKGISSEVSQSVTRRLYIPPYPAGSEHVESLNVSVATAITVAEFRRQTVSHG